MLPKDLKYTPEHEWVKVKGDRVIVGITDYAQMKMGDVVFVDLPSVGEKVTAKDIMFNIESVKNMTDIYAPISGEILETNDNLEHSPELVNQDPYGKGWLVVIEIEDSKQINNLLTSAAYASLIEGQK